MAERYEGKNLKILLYGKVREKAIERATFRKVRSLHGVYINLKPWAIDFFNKCLEYATEYEAFDWWVSVTGTRSFTFVVVFKTGRQYNVELHTMKWIKIIPDVPYNLLYIPNK